MVKQITSILALIVMSSSLVAEANCPPQQPKIGTVQRIDNGDLACYITLLDEKKIEHRSIKAQFEFCVNSERYVHQKVRLTYGLGNISDCQSAEPCGKTKQEWIIVKMIILNNL
jgi:hypothetical protein